MSTRTPEMPTRHMQFESLKDLKSFLTGKGVPWETWIARGFRSIDALWKNHTEDQVDFIDGANPPIIDVHVAVVLVYYREGDTWYELFEEKQVYKQSLVEKVRGFPAIGETLHRGEDVIAGVMRCLKEELKYNDTSLYSSPRRLRQERWDPRDSDKWLGLKSTYLREIHECQIHHHLYKSEGYVDEGDEIVTYFSWRQMLAPPITFA